MKNKHRFVVIDNETYKERISFQLTPINLVVTLAIAMVVLIMITSVIIVFTPLRRVIPGYINNEMIEQTYRNAQRLDSLQHEVELQQWFIANMQEVISDKEMPSLDVMHRRVDSLAQMDFDTNAYRHSLDDSLLRSEIRQAQRRAASIQSPMPTAPMPVME